MTVLDRVQVSTAVLDGEAAEVLSSDMVAGDDRVVEVVPPRSDSQVPATVPRFVGEIMELQSRWKLWNASPVTCFEIRRDQPDRVRLQFAVPTERLMRKVRLHLSEAVPGVAFRDGISGLPVTAGDTVGGGLLTLGHPDFFPLETDFDRPPTNNVVAALHRDAFPSESIVVQILFQPVAGRPVREWWWRRRAFKRVGWLRKEKHATVPWQERPATNIERNQSDAVEEKARAVLFRVGIRFLFTGINENLVRSRVKEFAGAFNVYESDLTNQYLDPYTVTGFRPSPIREFAEAVAYRRFEDYALPFRASIPELAGLVAVPTIDQDNLAEARP